MNIHGLPSASKTGSIRIRIIKESDSILTEIPNKGYNEKTKRKRSTLKISQYTMSPNKNALIFNTFIKGKNS